MAIDLHFRSKKKEEEEEGDRLGAFFYRIYEFLFMFSNPPEVIHRLHVPEGYTIKFIPAAVQSVNSVSHSASPVISSHVVAPAELPALFLLLLLRVVFPLYLLLLHLFPHPITLSSHPSISLSPHLVLSQTHSYVL